MFGDVLPAFIEEVPGYEVRNGHVHITCGPITLVMPVKVFQIGCERGMAEIRRWQRENTACEVIHLGRDWH